MSNFEDEKLEAYTEVYQKTVRVLRERNASKEETQKTWEADNGPKPPLHSLTGGPIQSEEEISKIATNLAKQHVQQMDDLKRIGMLETAQEKPRRGSLEAFFGDDKEAARKAREQQEHEAENNRQRELERQRDSNGRDMEP